MADEGDTEIIAADELDGPGGSCDRLFVALAHQLDELLHLLHGKWSFVPGISHFSHRLMRCSIRRFWSSRPENSQRGGLRFGLALRLTAKEESRRSERDTLLSNEQGYLAKAAAQFHESGANLSAPEFYLVRGFRMSSRRPGVPAIFSSCG